MRNQILIGTLAFGLILAGFQIMNISEEGKQTDGDQNVPVLNAPLITSFNSTIKSKDDVKEIFVRLFDKINLGTKEKAAKYNLVDNVNVFDEMIYFPDHVSIELRGWQNDKYWTGTTESLYVIIIPAVSKNELWMKEEGKILVERIKIKGQTGESLAIPMNVATYEEFKNYLTVKYTGSIEYQWVETKLWIKYLVDIKGTVYWAGEYLNPKPWLDY